MKKKWNNYRVTVSHDDGETSFATTAQSKERAIEIVMKTEGCPIQAIQKVEKVKETPRIVIIMDGGLVQNVLTDISVDVYKIDYDTDGADLDDEDLREIPQSGEDRKVLAYASYCDSEVNPKEVEELIKIIKE